MSRIKKNHLIIKYIVRYELDAEGIRLPVYKTKKVSTACVQRYMNCQHKLAKLTKCAEMLLRYITEEMDSSNNIVHTAQLRNLFSLQMSQSCGVQYADNTIKKAFYELVEQDLIISYGVKADYTVNPLYYFKGSEVQREKVLLELLRHCKKAKPNSNLKQALGV